MLWTELCVERTIVSTGIGPNSPTAPAASTSVPNGVVSSPLTDRMDQDADRSGRQR